MRSIVMACMAFAFAATAAAAQQVSVDPKQAPTGRYTMETAHSQLLFAIVHLGLTNYYGRFDHLSGTLNFNSAEPQKSVVTVAIDMTSIDTPSSKLAGDLAGAAVFDANTFPSASFTSRSITRTGPNSGKITGDLTIKNVTKSVTLDATFTGGRLNPMSDSYALGFHATATIKRSDFQLTSTPWSPFVSDDVNLIIEAMFLQQKG